MAVAEFQPILPAAYNFGMEQQFTVVLSKEPESAWLTVTVPSMPGLVAEGEGREAALSDAVKAASLWMEVEAESADRQLRPNTPEVIASSVAETLSLRRDLGWDLEVEMASIVVPVRVGAAA